MSANRCSYLVLALLLSSSLSLADGIHITWRSTIVEGDYLDWVEATGTDAVVTMTGGSIAGDFHLMDGASLGISGGEVGHDINVYQASTVSISAAATVHDDVYVYDFGLLSMSGGYVGDNLQIYSDAQAVISGGSVQGNLGVHDRGVLELRGSDTDFILWANGESHVHVYGINLLAMHTGGSTGNGRVSGKWATGQPFEFDIDTQGTWDHIVLHTVPEPATFGLLSLASIVVLLRRRTPKGIVAMTIGGLARREEHDET